MVNNDVKLWMIYDIGGNIGHWGWQVGRAFFLTS
jgi:hypothetical protein